MRIVKLDENTKSQALARLIGRAASGYEDYEKTVQSIIADVRESGDKSVISYEKKFDRCDLTPQTLRVSEREIAEAYREYILQACGCASYRSFRCLSRRKWAVFFTFVDFPV